MLVNLSILAALGLQLSAIAIPKWGSVDSNGHIGLWQACISGSMKKAGVDLDACVHLPPEGDKNFPKNSIHAIRAFSILSAILLFFALLCMMNPMGMAGKYKKCHLSCLVLAAVCSLISMIIWLAEFRTLKMGDKLKANIKPSYCFYFNIVSAVLALGVAGYLYKN